MSDRDISTGEGFTNGLTQADIEHIKRAIVSAIDAYRAGAAFPTGRREVMDQTDDAVKELCRQAWDAGQRDMLAKCITAVEECAEDYENDRPDYVSGMMSKADAVHRLTLLLDTP